MKIHAINLLYLFMFNLNIITTTQKLDWTCFLNKNHTIILNIKIPTAKNSNLCNNHKSQNCIELAYRKHRKRRWHQVQHCHIHKVKYAQCEMKSWSTNHGMYTMRIKINNINKTQTYHKKWIHMYSFSNCITKAVKTFKIINISHNKVRLNWKNSIHTKYKDQYIIIREGSVVHMPYKVASERSCRNGNCTRELILQECTRYRVCIDTMMADKNISKCENITTPCKNHHAVLKNSPTVSNNQTAIILTTSVFLICVVVMIFLLKYKKLKLEQQQQQRQKQQQQQPEQQQQQQEQQTQYIYGLIVHEDELLSPRKQPEPVYWEIEELNGYADITELSALHRYENTKNMKFF
ncbi:uncharacterized protein LOC130642042 [Hydractinia symbiolongicarpus]|uniref:uncharacterized protein LOC130642042 n=1 Tax=Hydractinia symbiolongicarpus TaxID=13093 RepID=UPI002550D918|nr:uncharacterized protein LOC130642042 [Hydractinia symbiolongicarpus]